MKSTSPCEALSKNMAGIWFELDQIRQPDLGISCLAIKAAVRLNICRWVVAAQLIAGYILGIAGMAINASMYTAQQYAVELSMMRPPTVLQIRRLAERLSARS
jgi:hypothetical protein